LHTEFLTVGSGVSGYLAKPSGVPGIGVVVLMEAFGLNAFVKSVCERFARAGYMALAPDIYHGDVFDYADRERAIARLNEVDDDVAMREVGASLDVLVSHGARDGRLARRMQPHALLVRDVLGGGAGHAHAAVEAREHAVLRQALHVAPHRLQGDAQLFGQLFHRGRTAFAHDVEQLELPGVVVHEVRCGRQQCTPPGELRGNKSEASAGKRLAKTRKNEQK
jgi:hypothetical protein